MTTPNPFGIPAEADLVDRIANALPAELRADYYRELRHCRALPEHDEMLRILRVMQFLTVLTVQVPGRIAVEREHLEELFRSSHAWQAELDRRLAGLPQSIADTIGLDAIVANINESLRQRFVESTIPQTAQALAAVGADLRKLTNEFRECANALGNSYHGAAEDARRAVRDIAAAISGAAAGSSRAAEELTGAFRQEYRWSIFAFSGLALVIGLVLGALFQRWVDAPAQLRQTGSAIVTPRVNPK